MERERFIRIPKDKKSMEDYDYGVQKNEQMEEMVLSEEKYKKLEKMGIFEKINEACDVIIDDYEEEVLELDKIPIAQEVIKKFISNNESEELMELKRMLDLAVSYKTIVGFDF